MEELSHVVNVGELHIPENIEAIISFVQNTDMQPLLIGIRTAIGMRSLSDRWFLRKVSRFYREIENVPQAKQKAFARKLRSEGKVQRMGEALLSCIERANREDKAAIAGKVFRAYLLEELIVNEESSAFSVGGTRQVTTDELDRIFNDIEVSYVGDLQNFVLWFLDVSLRNTQSWKNLTPYHFDVSKLTQTSFVRQKVGLTTRAYAYGGSDFELKYAPTPLGTAFAKVMIPSIENGHEFLNYLSKVN